MPRGDGRGPVWWEGRFSGCGFRLTVSRESIFTVLSKSDEHLSAEDIYLEVHMMHPNIGLTTVYRTIDLLVQAGIVFKYDFGDGRTRYELAEGAGKKEHHHHLVCTECGRIIDYTDFADVEVDLIKKTEDGLSKKYNFEIKSHILQFSGICYKCKK
ncbi:MAG: transcriptional repressor [bacterium]